MEDHSAIAGRRIALLTPWASRAGGGVAEAVVAQAAIVRDAGAVPVVVTLADASLKDDAERFGGAEIVAVPVRGPARFGFAPTLARELEGAQLDVLHLHGIWMYPSKAARIWRQRTGKPLVISPHGMLAPWITARGKPQKAVARQLYERGAWRAASRLHALTGAEAEDIRCESGRRDALVIPNAAPAVEAAPPFPDPVVAFIGRIHPKKNLAALIAGWEQARLPAEARLEIAGWGAEEDVAWLRDRIAEVPSARFLGPVYGAEKAEMLRRARFVALPSFSEGLPMAILESWAAGVPTVMSVECNLDEGFDAGAAFDSGMTAESVAAALTRAFALEEGDWRRASDAARSLADGPFSATTVAREWVAAYAALMDQPA